MFTLFFESFCFCCALGDKDNQLSGNLSYQQLGVAKLSAFREWLSLHPLISGGLDYTPEEINEDTSLNKMVIFAHHHKVLDGVQVSMLYFCLLVRFVLVLNSVIILMQLHSHIMSK